MVVNWLHFVNNDLDCAVQFCLYFGEYTSELSLLIIGSHVSGLPRPDLRYAIVGDLQHPSVVDHTVARLQVPVRFDVAVVKVCHALGRKYFGELRKILGKISRE